MAGFTVNTYATGQGGGANEALLLDLNKGDVVLNTHATAAVSLTRTGATDPVGAGVPLAAGAGVVVTETLAFYAAADADGATIVVEPGLGIPA